MKSSRFLRILAFATVIVLVGWLLLTLWAEAEGPAKSWTFGPDSLRQSVLIVYDPDPFYDLDEQVCRAFGEAMEDSGLRGTVATVAAARALKDKDFSVYVFCANTYNWSPDWAVDNFIRGDVALKAKPVVAITLGAGSTEWSKEALDKVIGLRGAMLIDSKSFWLWRPNDKSRVADDNVQVACEAVYDWGLELMDELEPYLKDDSAE
ncbi:MAG TPA: hypothetical protein VG737_05520 [Cyclobacteriaceae bacterium]|nr:hypothetical protein [Cyclobacteriaceae bacterium]